MRRPICMVGGVVFSASLASGVAVAQEGGAVPEDIQTRLLERFGNDGIDADGDGTLTHTEVRSFFEAMRANGDGPGAGRRGGPPHDGPFCGRGGPGGAGRGPGPGPMGHGPMGHGPMGPGMGGPPPIAMMLEHLERLDAETAPSGFPLERFPDADTDGDGELSDAEWLAFAATARERLLDHLLRVAPAADANDDGVLDDAELEALEAEVLARMKEHILDRHPEADTDGDGGLSEAELDAFHEARRAEHAAKILERHPEADLDGDGELTEEELHAFHEARRAEHTAKILDRHPEADVDGDGELSEEEARSFLQSQFPGGGGKRAFVGRRPGRPGAVGSD